MSTPTDSVLIIGGSGVVGSQAAHALRRLQPALPITIAGRDLARAKAVAADLGDAEATTVDLARPDLGLADASTYRAIAVFVKDDTLNSMRYAQDHGQPYVSLSSSTFEIGPEVALAIHGTGTAPILLASHWLAGAATLPALHFAAAYQTVTSIRISAVLDEQDMGGPAAEIDYVRITTTSSAALVREDGAFTWVAGEAATARITSVDGTPMAGQAYSPLDIVSLAAATAAPDIRLDLAVGVSAARRAGRPFSTEIIIDLAGTATSGAPARSTHRIVHPGGQAPLTALFVALAVERLIGRHGGDPVAPGLHLPELILDPAYAVRRMAEFGTEIESR